MGNKFTSGEPEMGTGGNGCILNSSQRLYLNEQCIAIENAKARAYETSGYRLEYK
jgi:hypothetical protein